MNFNESGSNITLINNIIDEVLRMDQIINKLLHCHLKILLKEKKFPISNKIYIKVKIKKILRVVHMYQLKWVVFVSRLISWR